MTVDVATPDESRMTRARRAFRRWRKSRPFWGGLLLILAGVEIFYSGNLNLGNIQIHLGLNGFKSYIIPLVVVLCGALTWATPAQRMFYGIIGTAAAVYSVVSVNLGGFIVGLLLGIFGGALSVAWVPDKRVLADGVDHTEPGPDDEDVTTEIGAQLPANVGEHDEQWRDPGSEESEEWEGEQREPFRQPRHAADDEPEPVVPTARTAPETGPPMTGPDDGPDEVAYPGDPNETTAPMPRVRSIPDIPHVRGSADAAGDDPPAGEQPSKRGDGHDKPRALTIAVIALTLGALAAFAIRNAAPAAADTCTPTPTQSAIQSAIAKSGVHQPAGTKAKAPGTTTKAPAANTAVATPKHNGDAALAPIAGDQPEPVASIVGSALGVLGLGSAAGGTVPEGTTATASGAASASADPTPTGTPSADPSSPAQTPTATPSPTATPTPTPTAKPRPTVTKSSPGPSTSRSTAPRPSTSSSAPPCSTTPRVLARASGQPIIGERPATQKTPLLTMTALSYDGNVALPTAKGSILTMQFSMSSTTSTPFELDVPVGNSQCTFKSSQLTLTGNVKIFATEIKGNLAGVIPVDYTPDQPPPLVAPVPDLFFTDATLTLAFVQSDTLTGDKLTITSD
jgi:Family of unknown function (DUF6114)